MTNTKKIIFKIMQRIKMKCVFLVPRAGSPKHVLTNWRPGLLLSPRRGWVRSALWSARGKLFMSLFLPGTGQLLLNDRFLIPSLEQVSCLKQTKAKHRLEMWNWPKIITFKSRARNPDQSLSNFHICILQTMQSRKSLTHAPKAAA